MLYNPDWIKKTGEWTLVTSERMASVRPQITRDYSWTVYDVVTGSVLESGSAPDRVAAFAAAESVLGYKWFIEKEYAMEKGCRCGSCTEPTGRWMVYDRADTVQEFFSTEGEAIAWCLDKHATASE